MPQREVDDWFWKIGIDFQRMGEEMVRVRPSVASGRCWEPRIDFLEEPDRLILKAELAGVRGEEVQVLYLRDRHSVLIRGRRAEDDMEASRTGWFQLEICYGPFEREVRLPSVPIDTDGIRASYRNGFLVVSIPKALDERQTRTISVTQT